MNASNARDMDRLAELLADEASAALDSSDAPELKGLLDRHPGVRRDEFMQAAALAQVAFLRQSRRSAGLGCQPPGLKERLASQGEAVAIRQRGPATSPRPHRPASRRRPDPEASPLAASPPVNRTSPAGLPRLGPGRRLAVALVVVRTEGPDCPGAGRRHGPGQPGE